MDVFSPNFDCQVSQQSHWAEGHGEASVPGCDVDWDSDNQQVTGPTMFMQTPTCTNKNGSTTHGDNPQRFLVCAMNATIKPDPSYPSYSKSGTRRHKRYDSAGDVRTLDSIGYVGLQDRIIKSPLGERADFGLSGAGPGFLLQADNMTCLICIPRYSVSPADVYLVREKVINITIQDDTPSRQIPGLSSWHMAISIFHSLGLGKYFWNRRYLLLFYPFPSFEYINFRL